MTASLPFELHVTINGLPESSISSFVNFCIANEAKPLIIELAQGAHYYQPMMSKVLNLATLGEAIAAGEAYSRLLHLQQFNVKRLKIEVPAAAAVSFLPAPEGFKRYYEWHGKINYIHKEALGELCTAYGVHLSVNALKYSPDLRFITLREYGDKSIFEQRVFSVVTALHTGGWELRKQQAEYCLYDDNVLLDSGWLA